MREFQGKDLTRVSFAGENLDRAIFRECNLVGANFEGANIRGSMFTDCKLDRANFFYALVSMSEFDNCSFERAIFDKAMATKLRIKSSNGTASSFNGANLFGSTFCNVNLYSVDFSFVNLSFSTFTNVNLINASLGCAGLTDVVLKNVKLDPEVEARLMTCPSEGSFVGWKKCKGGVLVKLLIPAGAKRSSSISRKCRAEYVRVLEVYGYGDVGISIHDPNVLYRKGALIKCDFWDPNRWEECAGGIHFFITKEEAQAYEC